MHARKIRTRVGNHRTGVLLLNGGKQHRQFLGAAKAYEQGTLF